VSTGSGNRVGFTQNDPARRGQFPQRAVVEKIVYEEK
jgi:hypothetical protein